MSGSESMSLSDCGAQLARMLGRQGRHSEAADMLKRLLTDLGEPVSEQDKPDWMWFKQELADQLVVLHV